MPAMPAAVRARPTVMAAAVAAHAALEQSFKESHVLLRRPAQVCLAGSMISVDVGDIRQPSRVPARLSVLVACALVASIQPSRRQFAHGPCGATRATAMWPPRKLEGWRTC